MLSALSVKSGKSLSGISRGHCNSFILPYVFLKILYPKSANQFLYELLYRKDRLRQDQ